jgi:hypothetical protein
MGAWIIMGILIVISVIFPPLALIIIPFIIVSILVGFIMRSLGNNLSEPTRQEIVKSSDRIVQAIDRLNAERWAAQYDDVVVQDDGSLRVVDDEPAEEEIPQAIAKPKQAAAKPKKSNTKSKKRKPRAKKKAEGLPDAKDLIKDIEDELFGKTK